MLFLFFILALIVTLILAVHITIEINSIEKDSRSLVEKIQKHYETEISEKYLKQENSAKKL
ncbi:MAG: hypothetical protein PVI26_07720 [Chitinispirillia bacterium]|jgi:hypothetical protein